VRNWILVVLFSSALLVTGCAQGGAQGKKQLIQEYNDFLNTVDEDFDKLNSINSKYPDSMSNDVYLEYASEMAAQLQYSVNHLSVFRAFLADNDRALRRAGIDVYEARILIEDQLTFYENTASIIHATLQEIQYEEQQKKELQEELLKSLPMGHEA